MVSFFQYRSSVFTEVSGIKIFVFIYLWLCGVGSCESVH